MFSLFFIFPFLVFADYSELSKDKEWLRLLYFKHHWFRGYQSSVDGEDFFLSGKKHDPLAELLATKEALEGGAQKVGKLKLPASCAFPLRKKFLESKLQKKFPDFPCPQKEDFLKKLDPWKVSLVFASAYSGNPASMFGHSFLKVFSHKNKGSPLLDWSVNYAAMVPEEENPFAFAYFGLTGGYMGQFSLVPFYAKVEEYGLSEGRDLWEYDLNLSREEVLRLVDAVWELEANTHLDYFFFDENCSFQILTLLEVVRLDWDISSYFLHMIPGESVKRVAQIKDAISEVRMRPSLERRFRVAVESLSADEKENLRKVTDGEQLNLNAKTLSVLALFYQAEKKRLGEKWSKESDYKKTLILLSEKKGEQQIPAMDGENTRPDISHGAYAISLGAYSSHLNNHKFGAELGIRFAYHDILDSDAGYLPHSEVLFPNFTFQWNQRKFQFQQIEAFSLISLQPWSILRRPVSWRTKGGYGAFLEGGRGPKIEAAIGSALRENTATFWALTGAQAKWREDPMGIPFFETGAIYTWKNESKLLLQGRIGRKFGKDSYWFIGMESGISYPISQNASLRVESNLERHSVWFHEEKILAVHYF
jgi:hypothetical protein